MKVIKKVVGYRVVCDHCMSVLEFELSDIKKSKYNDSHYITCPLCNDTTNVSIGYFNLGNIIKSVSPIYEGETDEQGNEV